MAYTESAQVDEEAVMSCKFQINDDLDNIRLTWHNAVHLVGAFMLGLLISPFWSWIAWLLKISSARRLLSPYMSTMTRRQPLGARQLRCRLICMLK